MLAEDFVKERYEKEGWKGYGHPPTESKEAIQILMNHFLGENYYVDTSESFDQVTTAAVYAILKRYPQKKDKRQMKLNKFKKILKKLEGWYLK
jgi:hypothetical protein